MTITVGFERFFFGGGPLGLCYNQTNWRFMDIFFLLIGMAGLWLASEVAISGALDIADHYRVSRTFVGLTVLAIGTDVPELFVNVSAAIGQVRGVPASDFIVGQTMGTSIAQICLMLGLAGLVATMSITRRKLVRDGGMLLAAALLVFLLGFDGDLSRADGLLMVIVYLVYFGSLIREEKVRERVRLRQKKNLFRAGMALVGGLALLAYSAEMTVDHALLISSHWGIAQSVVGALIVGLGTSLPELATSAMALRMGQQDLALGNLVGSTIFDVLMTLGLAATVTLLTISPELLYLDVLAAVGVSAILMVLVWKRLKVGRTEGLVLIGVYLAYFTLKLFIFR